VATPDTLGGTVISEVVAVSAKSFGAPENPDWAIDGGGGNWKSAAGDMPTWWQVQLAAAKVVTSYSISRRDDAPTRNVKDFTFQGSNDGSTWTTLDTRTGITWPTTSEVKTFTFTNSTAYSFYRVAITANNGDTYTSICEITFSGVQLASSGLCAWMKADAISGFTDGAALTSWLDSSYSRNTVATVVGTAPKYRASGGPNGLPWVDHTIVAGGLKGAAGGRTLDGHWGPASTFTFFAVMQAGTANGCIVNTNGGGSGGMELRAGIELLKAQVASIKTSIAGVSHTAWSIVIVTVTAAGTVVHFDISGTVEDYSVGGTTAFDTQINGLSYGSSDSTFNGKMAEFGIYPTVLSSGDLTSLKAYLTAKYFTAPQGALRRATIVASRAAQRASRW